MRGSNQALAHAQFVSNVADHGMNIQAALEAPRFTRQSLGGCDVLIESRVPAETREKLAKRGHYLDVRGEYSGLMGGGQAVGPDVVINPGGPHERHLLKANALPLEAGDIVELNTGGGGGFGKPFEREPEFVRTDVLDGYMTAKAAADVYGVVLTALSAVDKEATLRLREERPEPVLPVGGSAARR